MFWRPKDSMKCKCYVFSSYKQRNKVSLVYLECYLQQNRYDWYIFKLKHHKMAETTYLETSKQQTTYCWCFSMLKSLRKGNNFFFGRCQQRSKVQCMYWAFKNLKISCTKGQAWWESQKQRTNNVFWC